MARHNAPRKFEGARESEAKIKEAGIWFSREMFQGYKASGDPNLSDGVDVRMVVDREKNEYHQIVKDNLTGQILHEEHEPLTEHTAKPPRRRDVS